MLKNILIALLFTSLSLYGQTQKGSVKNDASLEWLGEHILARAVKKGKTCQGASQEEVTILLCRGETFNDGTELKKLLNNIGDVKDNILEEAVFNDLAKKAHFGASCMKEVTNTLLTDPHQKKKISEHVSQTWAEIEPLVKELALYRKEMKKKILATKLSFSNSVEFRDKLRLDLDKYQTELDQTEELVNSLFQSLPFADEPAFNKLYWKLANKKKSVRDPDQQFLKTIAKVNKGSKKSEKKYLRKKRKDGRYKLGHGDKRKLNRFFELEMIIDQSTRSEASRELLDDGFMCRMDWRYSKAPNFVRNTIDGVLIAGSVFTFGISGALGAASKTIWTAQKLRRAQIVARGLNVAGAVDVLGVAITSCTEALAIPKDYKVSTPKCSVEDTLSFQVSKKKYGQCAFSALVSSAPIVLSQKLRSIIRSNPRSQYASTYKPKAIKNFKSGDINELAQEFPQIKKNVEADRETFTNNDLIRPKEEATEFIDKQIDYLLELERISKLPEARAIEELKKLRWQEAHLYSVYDRLEHIKGFDISEDMLKGITAAAHKLADRDEFLRFLEDFQADVYATMKARGMTESLRKGELDQGVLLEVLEHRAAKLKLPVVKIKSGNEFLEYQELNGQLEYDKLFLDNLPKGLLMDGAFDSSFGHGAWPHYLQELYTVEAFQQAAGLSRAQDVLDFYKTTAGQEYFRVVRDTTISPNTLFDAESVTSIFSEMKAFSTITELRVFPD